MQPELTTMCYIEKGGKYLMLHRNKKKNDPNHDLWLGIGGHFECGETPEECIIREAKEETGLVLKRPELKGIVTFSDGSWHDIMFLYTACDFEGELSECSEGELLWVDKDKVRNELPIWEGDRIFLDLLEKNAPFFSLKLEYSHRKLISWKLE